MNFSLFLKCVKVGFHYPSWRPENSGAFFDTRQLGPWTRAVNSGSGNRPLQTSFITVLAISGISVLAVPLDLFCWTCYSVVFLSQ